MYAQATINTVVKTAIKPATEAVRLLGNFEKIYAPVFAALHRVAGLGQLVGLDRQLRGKWHAKSAWLR